MGDDGDVVRAHPGGSLSEAALIGSWTAVPGLGGRGSGGGSYGVASLPPPPPP